MKPDAARLPRHEWLLAGLLRYGTGLASAMIALGLALAFVKGRFGALNMPFVTSGIALFILLPVLRVTLMLIFFIRDRDYRFIAITAIVLMILTLGLAFGVHMARA